MDPNKVENCFKLKQAIGEVYPRFKPNKQQDPHDLLIILIGLCENLTKLTSYEVAQILKCTRCGAIKHNKD